MRMGRCGVGLGGAGIILHVPLAEQLDLHLHLILRRMIFTCAFTYEDGVGLGGAGKILQVSLAT